jgi:hypothetical protein
MRSIEPGISRFLALELRLEISRHNFEIPGSSLRDAPE